MSQNYFTCTLGQSRSLTTSAPASRLAEPFTTLNELLSVQAHLNPNAKAIGFLLPQRSPARHKPILNPAPIEHVLLSYSDVMRYSTKAAQTLAQGAVEHAAPRETIALLCTSSLAFLLNWLGLARLGHPVLLVAPQCAPRAIAHLCAMCGVEILLYDSAHKDLAEQSSEVAEHGLTIRPIVEVDLEGVRDESDAATEPWKNQLSFQPSKSSILHVFHTSGTSTGMPKPILQSHNAAIGTLPRLEGTADATFTVTPLYHGGIADLLRGWASGALVWMFPGNGAPVTADSIVEALEMCANQAEERRAPAVKYFSSVPFVLDMMRENARALDHLRRMDVVGVGGASLVDAIGDGLVSSGIRLASRFGSAECGFMLSSHRDYDSDKDWQYLRASTGAQQLRFEPRENALSELVVLPDWPCLVSCLVNPVSFMLLAAEKDQAKTNQSDGSYSTSDMFESHPFVQDAWKYHSRADEQITLCTGKKFDPAPLESALVNSELLQEVLIFGSGRAYPGALLFRSWLARHLSDEALIAGVRAKLEGLNSQSQVHARLSTDMLIPMAFLGDSAEKTSKGTLMRKKVEDRFVPDIKHAYERSGIADGMAIPDEKISGVLLQLIPRMIGASGGLDVDSDLPSSGLDSIASMRIRAAVLNLLPEERRHEVPRAIIEECGSITRLSQYLVSKRGAGQDSFSTIDNGSHDMLELVRRFGSFGSDRDFSVATNSDTQSNGSAKEVVVLTGATGTFGAHVLDNYRKSTRVKRIYCLVRGSSDDAAAARVSKALDYRNLEPLSKSDHKVVVISARLNLKDLGLSKTMYDQISREATVIVHLAWAVNFRLKLASFVQDHIAGLRHLLDLALSCDTQQRPPSFIFCSSVASVGKFDKCPSVPERLISDASTPGEVGYARSKWVAEQICQLAHERTRLKDHVTVVRVGQLSGDSTTGIWSQYEAWPLMLSTVSMTGTLPALENQPLDWLPVDLAAKAFSEITRAVTQQGEVANRAELKVYHLLNPHQTVTWDTALGWLQDLYTSETVSPDCWLQSLEHLEAANEGIRALSLVGFWKAAYGSNHPKQVEEASKQRLRYDVKETGAISSVMRDIGPVDRLYFGRLFSWIKKNLM